MTDLDFGLFGRKTDRGWEISDTAHYRVLDYSQESLAKISDDYPGAFKPDAGGTPHPSGLGTMPGSGTLDASSPVQGKGLVVKIAATHSGLLTRNNSMYLPDKMRTSVGTWTDIYPKPIQVHHEDHIDPVGRIIDARYVETVGMVADRFKNHVLRDSMKKDVGRADLEFWKDFTGTKKSFIEKIQMLRLMDSVLEDPHYQGVGYIELTADITDPAAIQKVLDGRFLTGSVGAVSDKAVCSVCSTNWLEEEHCGHRPGKVYDGKRCYVVAGNLEYDEYSFVNTPADRHSGVTSILQNGGFQDSVKDGKTSLFFYQIADNFHEEDSAMSDTNQTPEATEEVVKDENQEEAKTTEDVQASDTDAPVQDSTEASAESENAVEEDASQTAETDDSKVLDKLLAGDDLSAEEAAEVNALVTDNIDKLPPSSFVGPSKTLPVMDEATYAATKKVLDGLDQENEVVVAAQAKLARKAKAFGFNEVQDSVQPESTEEATGEIEDNRLTVQLAHQLLAALDTGLYGDPWDDESPAPVINDEQATVLRNLVVDITKRIGKDAMAKAVVDAGLAVHKDELEAQVEETAKLEDALGEKMDQLSILRQELQASYSDLAGVQDQLVDTKSKLRGSKITTLEVMHKLDGSLTDEAKEKFALFTDEVLDNSLDTIMNKVDMGKIADKVNDGLSRNPEGTVDSPVLADSSEPSTAEVKDTTRKPTFQSQKAVDANYRHFLVNERNPEKANAYYADAVKKGLASPKQSEEQN